MLPLSSVKATTGSPDVTHGGMVQGVEVSCGEAKEETDIGKAGQRQRDTWARRMSPSAWNKSCLQPTYLRISQLYE